MHENDDSIYDRFFIVINKIIDTYALKRIKSTTILSKFNYFCQSKHNWYISLYGIFINSKNSTDVSDRQRGQILIWEKTSIHHE